MKDVMKFGNLVNAKLVCKFLKWELDNPLQFLSNHTQIEYGKARQLLDYYLSHPDAVAFKPVIRESMNGEDKDGVSVSLHDAIDNNSLNLNLNGMSRYLTADEYLNVLQGQTLVPFSKIKALIQQHNVQVENASSECSRLIKSYAHAYLSYDVEQDTTRYKKSHGKLMYHLNPIYHKNVDNTLNQLDSIMNSFKKSIECFINKPCTDTDELDYLSQWTDDSYADAKIDGVNDISLSDALNNMYKDGSSFYYETEGEQYKCKLDNYAKLFYYVLEKFSLTYINISKLVDEPCLAKDANIGHIIDVIDNDDEHLTAPDVMIDYQNFIVSPDLVQQV